MTPLAKMVRIMETLAPPDQADLMERLVAMYGRADDRPLTPAERAARYRQRHAASRNGVTERDGLRDEARDAGQCISPVVLPEVSEVVRSEETETTKETSTSSSSRKAALRLIADRLIDFLNEKAGRSFRKSRVNLDLISARLSDGISEQDCRGVIARKCREWKADPLMAKYLRPETLFNRTKLESYLGEREPEAQ